MKKTSTRRIDLERYREVLRYRVCPGCGDYTVVDVVRRSRDDVMGRGRFLGAYHACGGPRGHACWHMTKHNPERPRPLYESA